MVNNIFISLLLVAYCFFYFKFIDYILKKDIQNLIIFVGVTIVFFSDFNIFTIKFETDIVLAFICLLLISSKKKIKNLKYNNLDILFLILMSYFVFQAFRGLHYGETFFSFRWILFFIFIIIINNFFKNINFDNIEVLFTSILKGYLLILILYIITFFLKKLYFPDLQIGRGFLFFPLTFISFLSYIFKKYKFHKISWLILCLSIISVLLSSSRGALLPVFVAGFLIFLKSSYKIKFTSLLFLSMIFFININEFSQLFSDTFTFITELFTSSEIIETRDLDRHIHLIASLESIMIDSKHFLFGYGFRSEGVILAESVFYYYKTYLPNLNFYTELNNPNNIDSFGIPALIVNYGIFGLILLSTYMTFFCRYLFTKTNLEFKIIITLILSLSFMRLFGNNFLSDYFLYALIMPNGFLTMFKKYYLSISN